VSIDRVIAIKITSDGRAFVVDQAANARAVQGLDKALEAAGKQADATEAKVRRGGRGAREAAEDVKRLGDEAGAAAAKVKKVGDEADQAAPKLTRKTRATRDTADATKRLGDTAERTAHQMRQVAPQVTDIVTSLASGQSAWMVAIQQGGQLKDVFGGIGPAARALTSYVGGMVNPFTLAAGAVGVLTAGFVLGQKESGEFNRNLILSGNAAGATASRYHEIAAGLAAIEGTRGAALEAVAEMAQRGRVGAENLERYSALAQQLDRLVGKPVAETAKEFAALAEAPVDASVKLTQTYNYLTAGVYEQIKALRDQGREVEAVRLAQDAFFSGMNGRVPEMQANLGLLERGWRNLKDVVSGAADAVLNVGRASTAQQTVALLRGELQAVQGGDKNRPHRLPWERSEAEIRVELQAAEERLRVEQNAAKAAAETAKQTQARARFDKLAEDALSKQEKLARAIAKAEAEGAAAGATRAEIEKVIANEKKKYIDTDAESAQQDALSARMARVKRASEAEAIAVKAGMAQVTREWQLGAVSHADYIDAVGAGEVKLLQIEAQAITRELEFARQKKNSLREVADLEGQLQVNAEKIAARRAQTDQEQFKRREDLERKARAFYKAQLDVWAADIDREKAAASERYEAAERNVNDYVRALGEESEELDFQIGLLGKNAMEQERLIELRRIDLTLRKELDDLDRRAAGGNLGAEEKARLERRAREAAAEAAAKAEGAVSIRAWQRTSDVIGDGFYLAITRRGRDARNLLMREFEGTVLQPSVKMLLSPVSGAISSMVSGGVNSVTQALGLGNLLGNAAPGLVGSTAGLLSSATYAAAVPGLTSFGAGSQAAMLAAQTADFGLAGLGATASAGGSAAGGLISSIGSALPYVGLALAVASLIGGATKGETRSGGQYTYSPAGGATFWQGPSGGDPSGEQAKQLVNASVATINSLFDGLGLATRVSSAVAGYEGSEKGRGGVLFGGVLSGGQRFGEDGSGSNYDGTFFEKHSPQTLSVQDAITNLVTDSYQGVIQAWQAAADEIRRAAGDAFADEIVAQNAEAMSQEAAKAFVERMSAMATALKQFNALADALPFEQLRNQTNDWISSIAQRLGGFDVLNAGIQGVYENYTTAGEKRSNTVAQIQRTLAAAGLNYSAEQIGSANRGDFRYLFDSLQGKDDEASRKAFAALVAVQGLFAGITESLDAVTEAAEDNASALDKLRERQDAGMDALQRAVAREKRILDARIQVGQEAVSKLSNVVGVLHQHVVAIYSETPSTAGYMAGRGRSFIDQALTSARAGYAPEDAQQLQEAISAVLGGMDPNDYATATDYQRDRLVLAGKLSELEGISGSQLSIAQQQLNADLDQVEHLDALVDAAREHIDAVRYVGYSINESLAMIYGAVAPGKGASPASGVGGGGGTTAGGGSGGVDFGGGGSLADFAAHAMNRLDDPAWIAAEAQRRNLSYADLARLSGVYSTSDVEAYFQRNGLSFDAGLPYVPYDMPVFVHRGERISTALENERGIYAQEREMASLRAEMGATRAELGAAIREGNENTYKAMQALTGENRRPLLVEVVS
jgi:hypothetical protein